MPYNLYGDEIGLSSASGRTHVIKKAARYMLWDKSVNAGFSTNASVTAEINADEAAKLNVMVCSLYF